MDDLPARRAIANNIRNMYGVKVDPLKHDYARLQELRARLVLVRRLKMDFNVNVEWHKFTVDELRMIHKEHEEEFMGTD